MTCWCPLRLPSPQEFMTTLCRALIIRLIDIKTTFTIVYVSLKFVLGVHMLNCLFEVFDVLVRHHELM